jgi:hypothetical protein
LDHLPLSLFKAFGLVEAVYFVGYLL